MQALDKILDYFQENREKIRLFAYFVLVLVLVLPLSEMVGAAWNEAVISRQIVRLRLFVGASHQEVSASLFGLYLGLLVLMSIDPKKRWQAFLLWIVTGLILVTLQTFGNLLPMNLLDQIPILGGGLLFGLLIGGGTKVFELRNLRVLEFRTASLMIYLLLSGITAISFLELHFEYPRFFFVAVENGAATVIFPTIETYEFGINQDGIIRDAAISVLFIVTLRQFVQYDAEKRFFILGPRASGKSLFLIGAFKQALERSREEDTSSPLKPSQDLASLVEALDRQDSEWIVEATGRGELKHLRFQYVYGSVFPINVQISVFDYAGEYLHRIPDGLTGAINPEEMDETLQGLVEGVRRSDTLILVIDMERFKSNEPLDIQEYFSILQETENKGVIIVATKCDVLLEDFEEAQDIDAHLNFNEFQEYITDRLRESENVDALLQETGQQEIHPVYYQTKVTENGYRIPMRDESGSVMPVGFDEFLDKIGRI